jgi:cytochrome c biogenesis factor
VFIGTLYPLAYEAVSGDKISVGPPYFNMTFGPIIAVLLLLVPIGPLLAWKRADAWGAIQRLWTAALIAAAVGLAILVMLLAGPVDRALRHRARRLAHCRQPGREGRPHPVVQNPAGHLPGPA